MENCDDIQTIKELLNYATIEKMNLRKLTTTSFRIELVFSLNKTTEAENET